MRFLGHMRPLSPRVDQGNGRLMHAKGSGDSRLSFPCGETDANRPHYVIAQLWLVVSLAFLAAVPTLVRIVFGCRTPSQVGERVIERVTVAVQRLVSDWARTNKGFQYQAMNFPLIDDGVAHQRYELVAVLVATPAFQLSPLACLITTALARRPHGPIVTDAIPRETDNVSELGHWFRIPHKGGNVCVS